MINLYTQNCIKNALVLKRSNIIIIANKGLASWNKSLIKPDYAEAYNNMGIVLQDQSSFLINAKVLKKAIAIALLKLITTWDTALQDQFWNKKP